MPKKSFKLPAEKAKVTETEVPDTQETQDDVNIETILVREVGQFGRYQQRVFLVALLVSMTSAITANEYLFTAARIPTRCLIPECESAESNEFLPPWLLNAIPGSSETDFDNCQRFPAAPAPIPAPDTCPAALFDQQAIVPCDQHVYANDYTIVYDFDLACDEWWRSFIGSARTVGSLLSLPLTGFLSDRWGRRPVFLIAVFNTAWLGLVRYFANTYTGFLILELVEAAVGSGAYSSTYILLQEITGPKYRVIAGACSGTFFTLGNMLLALAAWGVPAWRHLTLVLYAPQLLTISYYWLIPESIRWYMSKGHYDRAEASLKHAARVNGKELSENTLQMLRKTYEQQQNSSDNNEKKPWLVVEVFRHKPILLRCLVTPVLWITMTFVYYGLSINAVNMAGDQYVNYALASVVEIPGYWCALLLMSKVGRKPVLTAGYWLCAACQVAYIFLPDGLFGLSLAVFLVGKLCISMVATTLYVYTSELYPTCYRHSLFAFSSMIGRIGSILAPLTPALGVTVWEHLPFTLFGGMSLVTGALVLLAPETLGAKLPDTMEEAARLGRRNSHPHKRDHQNGVNFSEL